MSAVDAVRAREQAKRPQPEPEPPKKATKKKAEPVEEDLPLTEPELPE